MLMTDFGLEGYDMKENRTKDATNNAPFVSVLDTSVMYNCIAYRHSGRTNVLFADGHVASCEKGPIISSDWVPKGANWENGGTVY